jgi:hypothetical protein
MLIGALVIAFGAAKSRGFLTLSKVSPDPPSFIGCRLLENWGFEPSMVLAG